MPFAGSDALVACDASPRDEGAAATAAVPRAKQRPKSRKDKVDGASKDGTSMDADAAVEVVDLASAAASAKDSTGGTPDFDEAVLAKEFTETPDLTAAENATEEEVDFEQWLQNEGCDPRHKIGQRFGRSTAAKEASYKSASQTEKREMRRKWGEAEIARLKETRTFAKSWTKVDQTKGTYVPFAVLWEREGGVLDPRGAHAAAMEYARACIRMKGPWVSANPVTGRLEYLHLERSVKEQFTKCWTLFKSEAEAAPCGKGQGDNGADSSTRLKGKKNKEPAAATDDGHENKDEKKKRRVVTPLQQAIADAVHLKATFTATMASAHSIVEAVAHEDAWAWAKHEATFKELGEGMARLVAAQTPFARRFHCEDLKAIKKDTDDSSMKTNMDAYIATIKEPLAFLETRARALVGMHHARSLALG